MEQIEAKVKEIISSRLGVKQSDISPESSFTKDLGADSLDIVELIMEFEKEFEIEISDEDAQRMEKVGDAIEYLKNILH